MIVGDSAAYPVAFRLAARAVYALHIGAGLTGIISGVLALAGPKGGGWHRRVGATFFVSMLIMSGIGAAVSPFIPQRGNVVPGLLTFYLTATAWATVRLKDDQARRFEIAAMAVAAAACALGVTFALTAVSSPGGLLDAEPASTYSAFALFPAFAAVLDVTVIWRRGVSGPARLARHPWRMSLALFIACGSLFLGQPKVFPPGLRGSPILFAPEVFVLGLMAFWLIRVGFPSRLAPRPARPRAGDVQIGLGLLAWKTTPLSVTATSPSRYAATGGASASGPSV
jgi:uncharacterized membrane protein